MNGGAPCHCLQLPYCDGGSYAGSRNDYVRGPRGERLLLRGLDNVNAAVEAAIASLGLANASEVVVSGFSAGGLAAVLHADRVAARLGGLGSRARVSSVAQSGYFLQAPAWQRGGQHYGARHVAAEMRAVTALHNLTPAPGGALSARCAASYPGELHTCAMAPYVQRFAYARHFLFGSKYDAWQLVHDVQLPCYGGWPGNHTSAPCTPAEQAALRGFGKSMAASIAESFRRPSAATTPTGAGVGAGVGASRGAFLTSRVCHANGCPWATLRLRNRSGVEHYRRWYRGDATGADAIQIDRRSPNAGGRLAAEGCWPFP